MMKGKKIDSSKEKDDDKKKEMLVLEAEMM